MIFPRRPAGTPANVRDCHCGWAAKYAAAVVVAKFCQYESCKIDGGVWIESEARQIQSKPPIENIVEREIAEIAQTIGA